VGALATAGVVCETRSDAWVDTTAAAPVADPDAPAHAAPL